MPIVNTQVWQQYNSGMDHLRCRTPFGWCNIETTEYIAQII